MTNGEGVRRQRTSTNGLPTPSASMDRRGLAPGTLGARRVPSGGPPAIFSIREARVPIMY